MGITPIYPARLPTGISNVSFATKPIHDPDIDPMARASTSDAIEHSGFGSAYSSHFDLTMRARGKIKVRGQAYDVDCLATNDHSWGPRPERGMRMMGYMNAHFDNDYVVQTIWEFDAARPDGEQHVFKHGYAIVDGELRGGIAATLKVMHSGIFPKLIELSFTNIDGRITVKRTAPSMSSLSATRWPVPTGNRSSTPSFALPGEPCLQHRHGRVETAKRGGLVCLVSLRPGSQ